MIVSGEGRDEHESVDKQLSEFERVARDHERRLRRLEAELGIIRPDLHIGEEQQSS
jgi:hypothetical protein